MCDENLNYYLWNSSCFLCTGATYTTGSSCLDCDEGCSTCSTNPDNCTVCDTENHWYLSDYACIYCNEVGYYNDRTSCEACNQECLTCEDTASNCLSCNTAIGYVEDD